MWCNSFKKLNTPTHSYLIIVLVRRYAACMPSTVTRYSTQLHLQPEFSKVDRAGASLTVTKKKYSERTSCDATPINAITWHEHRQNDPYFDLLHGAINVFVNKRAINVRWQVNWTLPMVDCFGVLSVLVWLRLASSSAHKAWSVIAIRNQTESRPLLSPLFGRLCCDWLLAFPLHAFQQVSVCSTALGWSDPSPCRILWDG